MAITHPRRRFVLMSAAAVAAVSLSACTTVVDGAAVAGDRGPCTHVGTPMVDVPASGSTEPQVRIPQPAGWERTPELEEDSPHTRLALSDDDAAVMVMVESVPEDNPSIIFDDFQTGLLWGAEEEGMSVDVIRTPNTLCGLPTEAFEIVAAEPNAPSSEDAFKTVAVVAESRGDTYLVAVVQVGGSDDPEVETVLSGIEVLPQEAATA